MDTILTSNNLKNTKHRNDILNVISNSVLPLSAEEIYRVNNNINLSTIYRTLNILTNKEVLIKENNNGVYYYQLNNHHHKHILVCSECSEKILIEDCPVNTNKIAKSTGYKITGHNVELTSICPKCL